MWDVNNHPFPSYLDELKLNKDDLEDIVEEYSSIMIVTNVFMHSLLKYKCLESALAIVHRILT